MGETKYKPKVVLCRLHTAGKTVEQIQEELKGQGFTCRDFRNMVKSNEYFDGLELWASMWNWDNHESWHLWNWKKEDDEKVMMGLYHAEQFHPFPRYKNEFEKFKADWEAEAYDPGCTYTFPLEAVEVLEVVQEEENNIEPEEVKKAVRQAEESKRQRSRKDRATKKKYHYKKRR